MADLRGAASLILLLVVAACSDPVRPSVPLPGGSIVVDSDPTGAAIALDGEDTGLVTPATLEELATGTHRLVLSRALGGFVYTFDQIVPAPPKDSVRTLLAPLLVRCGGDCGSWAPSYQADGISYAASPSGTLFYRGGAGGGILYPLSTTNSYASVGTPSFAAVVEDAGDTVTVGPYDTHYLSGRPAPLISTNGTVARLRQTVWVVPPGSPAGTARGVEIEQEIIGSAAVEGVLVVRLLYRNISHLDSYRAVDPTVPEGGITYDPFHPSFLLDADVAANSSGASSDDLVSYDPALDMVFAYDAAFAEPGFEDGWDVRPALVGLRVLEAPAGATTIMNAWTQRAGTTSLDWRAGTSSEANGWAWITATNTELGNHADARIGFAPSAVADRNDYRLLVSAGPLRLAPGDSARFTVAVVLAPPEPGTFTSAVEVAPGDPFDTARPLYAIAQQLRQRAVAAETLLP